MASVRDFLQHHWPWVLLPWLVFGAAVLVAAFLGGDGDAPFVYSLG